MHSCTSSFLIFSLLLSTIDKVFFQRVSFVHISNKYFTILILELRLKSIRRKHCQHFNYTKTVEIKRMEDVLVSCLLSASNELNRMKQWLKTSVISVLMEVYFLSDKSTVGQVKVLHLFCVCFHHQEEVVHYIIKLHRVHLSTYKWEKKCVSLKWAFLKKKTKLKTPNSQAVYVLINSNNVFIRLLYHQIHFKLTLIYLFYFPDSLVIQQRSEAIFKSRIKPHFHWKTNCPGPNYQKQNTGLNARIITIPKK